ncbi:B-cell receptor CD22-like isoform X2 [Poecilia reticulata]|uniref:B-cell receptor CD22-like isoform X2 n=1 Tax=Poecilia reticulata TaxID=8081 RepID=UPI0004A4661C|nr:PREDICTED: B-cell receptor CD22-like isoform X2 [Poecilia reticulata]
MGRWIIIILGLIPGVWSGTWGVTYENQCALRGTSVDLKCEYGYTLGNIVTRVSWFKAQQVSNGLTRVPLSQLPSPPNHFKYIGDYRGNCNLRINNVQPSDQGAYYFNFAATLGSWESDTYAFLSVRELTTVVEPSVAREGDAVRLKCKSGCPETRKINWFKDGRLVQRSQFQANREDAGSYFCAIQGEETVRSASVDLSVHYAPTDVTLSVSPSGDVVRGSLVTLTCSGRANPPVARSGYRLYKDAAYVSSGQSHVISDVQPRHRGRYHCQAWNNISRSGSDLINSSAVHLDVRYQPMNVSVSVSPEHIVEGSGVNLTCISDANPAAENYTWYKRTEPTGSHFLVHVGSEQVLSLPSMEASHSGLYVCYVRNSLGEGNSTEVVLAMAAGQHGSQSLPILAGVGLLLIAALVAVLLLFWRKQRSEVDKKTHLVSRIHGGASNPEEPTETVYSNIHVPPTSPPPAFDPYSFPASRGKNTPKSSEAEIIYTTVTVKPRDWSAAQHKNSGSKGREDGGSVIYSSVVKSSR